MNNYVLVTGGAGYIGLHIIVELLSNNYNCIILDNFVNSFEPNLNLLKEMSKNDKVELLIETCDITDYNNLENVFIKYNNQITTVIHLAALKSVPESVKYPDLYYKVNVLGTNNVINLSGIYNVKTLCFSSSATVYNSKCPTNGYDESMISDVNEVSHSYGKSKILNEQYIVDNYKRFPNMKIFIFRYFNPIGNHPSGLIGQGDCKKESTSLIDNLLKSLNTNTPFTLHGSDYIETIDGTPMRDFIDVCDLAKAHIIIINEHYDKKDNKYLIYNIGTGKAISVLECINTVNRVFNNKIEIRYGEKREGDAPLSFGNINYIKDNSIWFSTTKLETSLKNIKKRNEIVNCKPIKI